MFILIKIFFSRISRPISIKLGTNHPYVKGILNCSNKRSSPLQRGDNLKNAKMGCVHLEIFFSRTNVDSSFLKSWSPGVERGHSRENHIHLCLY
jgi:hypothetical protein